MKKIIQNKKKIAFFIASIFFLNTQAQITFQKTFGGTNDDGGKSVQQTADGGYIIAGYTKSFGAISGDVYLIKTDAYGDSVWTKTFGGTNPDDGRSVQQTTDGGYIITGKASSFGAGNYDIYLIKTDANGDSLWTKTFGGSLSEEGYSVQQTADGGYIVAGSTWSFGSGNSDIFLNKTDSNGDLVWSKTFGGTDYDYGFSAKQTTDGGYIIAGETKSFGAINGDAYLIKTDINGDLLWSKILGGIDAEWVYSVEQTTDGGYIITGNTNTFGTGGDYDVYLIKTDDNGDLLWTKTFGEIDGEDAYSVQQTFDGGYIITGFTYNFGAGSSDVYLIRTNTIGDTLWTKTFGGPDEDQSFSLQQTTDGGYIITGFTTSFSAGGAGDDDIYLIKTDSLGNSGCNEGSTASIVTTPATQITGPATIVTSPAAIVTSPATVVGSGGIVATLCITVGIHEIKTDDSFLISPNPFTSEISIIFPKQNINQATFTIKNILGQTVFTEQENNLSSSYTKTIDLTFLLKGIYLLDVNAGGERMVRKIVKE